jgi:flap endonuclease-1
MGIQGLKKIIKKHAEKSLREVDITFLNNSTIAIDSSILLYKYRYIYSSDDFHIIGFNNLITELKSFNIKPVFVFDGKPPEAKQDTLNKRIEIKTKLNEKINLLTIKKNELIENTSSELVNNFEEYIDDSEIQENTSELNENTKELNELFEIDKELSKLQKNNLVITRKHSKEVMELLTSLDIDFIKAIGEAEEYCSFLQKNNFVDYVLTEDTDSLTFGAKKVLFNIPKTKNKFLLVDLDLVLSEMVLTYSQFIDFCILCGCDYTCTIPKVGPVTALKLIKDFSTIEGIIGINKYKIPDNFNYLNARSLFIKNEEYSKENIEFNKKIKKPLFI